MLLLQTLGNHVHLSASGFNSWFTDIVRSADSNHAYAGLYLGWPVEYIDFPVNEGHARTYGGTLALRFLHAPDAERRIEATAAVALADGLVWERPHDPSLGALPIGAMAPVQLRFSADVDWHRWSVAPRLAVVGAQRLLATTDDDAGKCLARLVASLNAMPASVLLQIALADDLLEGRVVPVVEAAIGMAAAGLTEYRDAGELLSMFADLADAVRSRTLN